MLLLEKMHDLVVLFNDERASVVHRLLRTDPAH